jgi:putative FmdB family regulatory protein
MPMYEYECKKCGSNFDLLRSINQDDSDVVCSDCGSPNIQRKLSLFASHTRDAVSTSSFADTGSSCSSGLCGCSGPTCGL